MCNKMKKLAAVLMAICMMSGAAGLWADPAFPLDAATVPAIDRWAIAPYNDGISKSATVSAVGMMGLPVLLAVPCMMDGNTDDLWRMGCEYSVIMGGTYASKELLKTATERARPYMYTANPPQDKIDEGVWNRSFPSGHAALSFAAAGYFSLNFCQLYPESEWKVAACSVAYAGATAVSALRVASGSHFVTDVATGALLGTLWGYGVPLVNRCLNTRLGWNSTGNGIFASPAGVAVMTKW